MPKSRAAQSITADELAQWVQELTLAEEKANAEARRAPRGAEAREYRRMERRSGVPAICFAGTQGLAPIDVDAPP
jgi:hypothetical protein